MASVAKQEAKVLAEDSDLSAVIDDLDEVFSQYIRLRDSDENGYVECYCRCGTTLHWTESQCMHFVPRAHQNTRFSEENCHGGCPSCNELKKGNLKAYGDHLEEERPGIVEALEEQARAPYKYSVSELKGWIAHYAKEVSRMKKLKPMKL